MTCTPKPFNGMMMMMTRIQIIQMTMTRKMRRECCLHQLLLLHPFLFRDILIFVIWKCMQMEITTGLTGRRTLQDWPSGWQRMWERETGLWHFPFLSLQRKGSPRQLWVNTCLSVKSPTKDCPLHCIISFEKRTPVKPVESTLFFEREDRRK